MPTPSRDDIVDTANPSHNSCPPEDDRPDRARRRDVNLNGRLSSSRITAMGIEEDLVPSPAQRQVETGLTEIQDNSDEQSNKQVEIEVDGPTGEVMSPASVESKQEASTPRAAVADGYIAGSPSMNEFSSVRLIPSSPSSFLRAGSQFRGTQQSERQVYEVQVDIKHVDMRESFLCGYLRIQGLTEDHPTLTTYFEGEIIGTKYSFLTQHEDWGSTDKVDLQHWAKFPAFRPYTKKAKQGNLHIRDLAQKDNIFMRWKEHFLVPDHRVRTITGASFEGFYYICFNQIEGAVSGIYFHAKSEKFQQLELKHVPDRGCFKSMEFR